MRLTVVAVRRVGGAVCEGVSYRRVTIRMGKDKKMKICALLLLGLSATLVEAQELNLGTLTVADVQRMYEAEGRTESTKKVFQTFFNGYGLGFVHGIASALIQSDIVSRDVSPDFANCMPNTQRLFYELLSVSDERANLSLAQFTGQSFLDQCQTTLTTLLENQNSS